MPNHGKPGFTVICENCSHEFFQPESRLNSKVLDPCPACGADNHFDPDEWESLKAGQAEAFRLTRQAFSQSKLTNGWRKR